MPPRTFDWRDDPTGTVIAVPDVRARFLQRKPEDPLGGFHSHEESNGIETWVVLEGKVRFEFDDGEVIATPGQSVVAYPHEKHRVSCAGDEPCVYFLTLTPHREPTHTFYDDQGNRLPSRVGTVNTTWCGEPSLGELPAPGWPAQSATPELAGRARARSRGAAWRRSRSAFRFARSTRPGKRTATPGSGPTRP